jgi:pimeloyl-ACP methyl ester carboxylesterase
LPRIARILRCAGATMRLGGYIQAKYRGAKGVTETLVLVPGLLCDATVWAHQQRALAARVRIHVADHGARNSLPAMAEAILQQVSGSFAVAGHSMGGRVAFELVRRAPERISGLALLDTNYEALASGAAGEREAAGRKQLLEQARRNGMRPMAWQWLQHMIHPSRLADHELTAAILAMFERKTPDIFEAQITALLNRPDATAQLPQIRCPTLVLCGREDAWSTYERHVSMAQRIPRAALVAVPQCGHMSTMERPHAVSAAMDAWLDTLER